MQLEKSSDGRFEASPSELNTTNFVKTDQERRKQETIDDQKPSIEGHLDSPA